MCTLCVIRHVYTYVFNACVYVAARIRGSKVSCFLLLRYASPFFFLVWCVAGADLEYVETCIHRLECYTSVYAVLVSVFGHEIHINWLYSIRKQREGVWVRRIFEWNRARKPNNTTHDRHIRLIRIMVWLCVTVISHNINIACILFEFDTIRSEFEQYFYWFWLMLAVGGSCFFCFVLVSVVCLLPSLEFIHIHNRYIQLGPYAHTDWHRSAFRFVRVLFCLWLTIGYMCSFNVLSPHVNTRNAWPLYVLRRKYAESSVEAGPTAHTHIFMLFACDTLQHQQNIMCVVRH